MFLQVVQILLHVIHKDFLKRIKDCSDLLVGKMRDSRETDLAAMHNKE
jgi:hypothetical protein